MAGKTLADDLLEGLSVAIINKSEKEVLAALDLIIDDTLKTGTSDCVGKVDVSDHLQSLLDSKSDQVLTRTTRLIAELSKCEGGRSKCATQHVVSSLVGLLGSKDGDVDVLTQAFRALGNICYENDVGRKLALDADCIPPMLRCMERSLEVNGQAGKTLRLVAAGFTLNLLIGHEDIQKNAVERGVIPLLCGILELDACSEETANHVMLTFGLLADSAKSPPLLDERMCKATVLVLGSSTSPELSEMCLELLHGQAEDEGVKVHLARSGVCELLFDLLEKHKPLVEDEDTRSIMKMACDLIVLILTGDASMNILYANGDGKVFEEMVSWLSSDDDDLQITGVLAMGNFARTDKHCIQMVGAGVSAKLLALVQKNNTCAGDVRLQHALLSAIRNLVIPVQNKATVLANGLVDVVYPMLEIPTFPVVFKLLGTLRMVIDGQESTARDLGRRKGLIERLVTWCSTEDHPGVQGEANRLLAWLIKNSRDVEVVKTMTEAGAVQCLVTMLTAEHAVMQNEALLALTILTAMRLSESEGRLLDAKLGAGVARLLNEYGCSLAKEVILNVLALIGQLDKSGALKIHLVESDVKTSLASLLSRGNVTEIHDQIHKTISDLETPSD